jgi:hypothetical protein
MIRIEITAVGGRPTIVEIPRTERSRPGPVPPRPGSDPKEKLTLANLFTSDGLLGDSDSNRIVDRFDMLLPPATESKARLSLQPASVSNRRASPSPSRSLRPPGKAGDEPTLSHGISHPLIDQLVRRRN